MDTNKTTNARAILKVNRISSSKVGIGKITMPSAANTRIGVPKPPKKIARLAHRDEKTVLIASPKKMNVLASVNMSYILSTLTNSSSRY